MTFRRWTVVICGLSFLASTTSTVARTIDSEVLTVEDLIKRSGEAYRSASALEITLATSVELPNGEPGERVVRYLLGKDSDASIEIGNQLKVVASGNTLYAERIGSDDRYFETPYAGDLGKTLEEIRGNGTLAGLWEPPQMALRMGKPLVEVINAFRYSSLLEELEVESYQLVGDSIHEVRLKAANGSCTARFEPESFRLSEVEYVVQPPDAPENFSVRIRGRYETRILTAGEGIIGYDPGDRTKVETFRELSPPPPGINRPPNEIISTEQLARQVLDIDGLAAAVREKRVLLIGEDHLYNELPAYLAALLDRLDDRPISLLLELPYDVQPLIDHYVQHGDQQTLSEIFDGRQVLQLQTVLLWAHENRGRVLQVQAMDEPLYEIFVKRAYFHDTRNQTMAEALYQAWKQHPEGRVVAYAGQLHMMLAGRYRLDQPSRETAGSRLLGMGVPRDQVTTIQLNGGENFHLHAVWNEPGALPLEGEMARIPIPYFIDYPIFGATRAGEVFDFFVNVGALTQVEMK